MLQRYQSELQTPDCVYLEPVEDLTQAYIVHLNDNYVGRVFKSIWGHFWMTSGIDNGHYESALDAAFVLIEQWETRRKYQENGLDNLPF